MTSDVLHQIEAQKNMSDLPDGWEWTTLGDICSPPQYGWTTSAATEGDLHLLRTTDITSGEIDWSSVPYCEKSPPNPEKYLLRDGDIVISRAGSVGYSYLLRNPRNAVFASYLIRFTPKQVLKEYIAYFLNSPAYWQAISESKLGIAVQNVNASKLKQISIPLAPLAEQKRIVDAIEAQFTRLDAAVAGLQRLRANLQRYRQSVLKAACEGRLVPTEAELARAEDRPFEDGATLLGRILAERRRQWEADNRPEQPKNDKWKDKYREPAAPDLSSLPDLPDGWVWVCLDQVADQRLGKMLDKAKNQGTLRPYLRNINVRWFEFDLSDVQSMRIKDAEFDTVSIKQGDLVVCEGGEPGRAAVWQKQEPMAIQKALHRVRPYSGVSAWYVAFKLAADASSGKLEKYFTGSTIKHFTGQSLRTYLLPLPPLAEQQRIVEEVERRLSVIEQHEQVIAASLKRAERLRQSILKRAFAGQL